jgi:hypothetical protein
MNTASAHENRNLFARVIGAVAAFVEECNYASTRLARMHSPLLAERAASRPEK